MLEIAFFYDPRLTDFWDQLVRTFAVNAAHVVGLPEDFQTSTWQALASVDEIENLSSPRTMFSPASAELAPGAVALSDYTHPDEAVYVFGSDEQHNPAIDCDAIVYVPTPRADPLWSVQAAAIVLHDRWSRGNP